MLRQALDAAVGQQPQTETEAVSEAESDQLLPDTQEQTYASTTNNEEYGDIEAHSYEEEEYILEDWHSRNGSSSVGEAGLVEKFWRAIKSCFFLVANVENLWDSPSLEDERPVEVSRRNHFVVLFWFFILATSYASERLTFKMLVDRTGPFRLFAVEMVTFSHAFMIGIGMLVSCISRKDFQMKPLGIPVVDVGLMALLDTVHILLVFLTGLHVPPTSTVILVQFTLPLTALLTQLVHPDGCGRCLCNQNRRSDSSASDPNHSSNSGSPQSQVECVEGRPLRGWGGLSSSHLLGCVIITLAVLLALCPAIYSICDPIFFLYADSIPIQTAYNTLLFVSSCIPAAASQLYKEHIFLQYKQPVQADHLNFIISAFQLIFASIMSPLVFALQGLGAGEDWTTLYPSSGFSANFIDGLQCFLGTLDEDRASNGYAEPARCNFALGLVLLYSFSIIAVGVAVDKIVNAGATKVIYRGVSAGIIVSVISLYSYDMRIPTFNYGAAIDSLNLVCLLLLIVGSEVYHRVSLQDATFQTIYPEVENFFDDE